MIDELLSKIEKIEDQVFDTFRNSEYKFDKDAMDFLNNFGDEIEKVKEFFNDLKIDASIVLNEKQITTSLSQTLRDLYIVLAKIIQDKINITFTEKLTKDVNVVNILDNTAKYIIEFKPLIKKLKRQYDEYLKIENSNSIFDESKIDKKQVLTYINQSLEELKKETIIPEKEKEKLIIIYKEVIKEVEKKQTNWQKVLGFFNVIAIACTLYTSAPVIKDDIIKASQEISKGVRIVPEQTEPKIKVLENQSILIDIKQS